MSVRNHSAAIAAIGSRGDFRFYLSMPTRWKDNDVYGHVNNSVYFSYIDTVCNRYLIDNNVLDIGAGGVIGFAVETGCQYRQSVCFPNDLDLGLRAGYLGGSSVRYDVGIFGSGEESAAAVGFLVHVFVDRESGRPVPIPENVRVALTDILVEQQ